VKCLVSIDLAPPVGLLDTLPSLEDQGATREVTQEADLGVLSVVLLHMGLALYVLVDSDEGIVAPPLGRALCDGLSQQLIVRCLVPHQVAL
jgi:hypothetical protein